MTVKEQPSDPSASNPDWGRERITSWWDPSRKLLRAIRRYQATGDQGSLLVWIARKRWSLSHWFWSVITQAEIDLNARIGGGLLLPHPNGIVVHPGAVIGPNCLIFQQVTIGTVAGSDKVAVIGGHVDIGAGAKILGDLTIGDHAVIGANAVVTKDVPANAIAVGIPAKVRPGNAAPATDK